MPYTAFEGTFEAHIRDLTFPNTKKYLEVPQYSKYVGVTAVSALFGIKLVLEENFSEEFDLRSVNAYFLFIII